MITLEEKAEAAVKAVCEEHGHKFVPIYIKESFMPRGFDMNLIANIGVNRDQLRTEREVYDGALCERCGKRIKE